MKKSRKKNWIIYGNVRDDRQSFFGPFTLRQAKQRIKILDGFVQNIKLAQLTHIA